MISQTAVFKESDAPPSSCVENRLPFIPLLLLSAWCGLLAGLLEVGAIVLRKHTFDPNHLYGMSRHFVWLIPATNFGVFLVVGLIGCLAQWAWPRRGGWLCTRALCSLTLVPMLLVAFSQIYGAALAIVALGVAAWLVPLLERNVRAFQRFVQFSFPVVVGTVVIIAALLWVGDRIKQRREHARPLPPSGSPSVLLIVLDAVAADHLSLHGYDRRTSSTLAELAERGVRFDSARATSSWTLASHATMFTGRWLHELTAGWLTPLDDTYPTLAEFLAARGYATAGFVANTRYCATDSGLGRGFTRYEDFIFPELTAFKSAVLVNRALWAMRLAADFLADALEFEQLRPRAQRLLRALEDDRKEAAVVNRELLYWLSHRQQPGRPFFAFLNYFDAHYPYELPRRRMHRFGTEPIDNFQRSLIRDWFALCRAPLSPQSLGFVMAAYDDCIADLDEQVGRLVDELRLRGVLEKTWLIITSDHGESFGEHERIFCHGTSLYQTELHVPLLIIPPGALATKTVVNETVSLRDLAATVVDMVDQEAASPFPGKSLARFWDGTSHAGPAQHAAPPFAPAELALPTSPPSRDPARVPKNLWPRGGLAEGEWSYIRHEGDLGEELFHLREDAREQHNLAGAQTARPTLERMRAALDRITAGPLVPERFSP